MPRACPVVVHVRCYNHRLATPHSLWMPRACPVEFHAKPLRERERNNPRGKPVAFEDGFSAQAL
jgi:hypothetical protein